MQQDHHLPRGNKYSSSSQASCQLSSLLKPSSMSSQAVEGGTPVRNSPLPGNEQAGMQTKAGASAGLGNNQTPQYDGIPIPPKRKSLSGRYETASSSATTGTSPSHRSSYSPGTSPGMHRSSSSSGGTGSSSSRTKLKGTPYMSRPDLQRCLKSGHVFR